ncbi:MAG: UDP-N-acetylmuramate dehydrogenase [Rhodovibrionaceae bacterium]
MAAARSELPLVDRLPAVRGRLTAEAPLDKVTWFRVGGAAEVMFRPADREDLLAFLRSKPAEVPVTVLGVGSNSLVRSGGIPGVVLRLGRDFAQAEAKGENLLCGGSCLDVNAATAAQQAGIAGLEFLAGVPGTIGGGVRMNAGAYGKEFKDVLRWAEAVEPDGRLHRLSPTDLDFGYRHSALPEDWIVLQAELEGEAGEPKAIAARIKEIQEARAASQPIRTRTGGSTFKNPPGEKAWQLIDAAGCRGLMIGGAQVSEMHCNFLINTGTATAEDLETLGEEVRRRVKANSGIELEWEIRRIGVRSSGKGDRS